MKFFKSLSQYFKLTEMAQIDKTGSTLSVNGSPLKSLPVEQIESNMIFWHNKKNSMFFPKGTVMVWFLDDDESRDFFRNGEDLLFFTPPARWDSSPVHDIWRNNNSYQKHILGVLKALVTDTQIYIDMMSVREGYMKNGINNFMIKGMIQNFPGRTLKFSKPSPKGEAFIQKYYPEAKIEGLLSPEEFNDLYSKIKSGTPLKDYSEADVIALARELNINLDAANKISSDSHRYQAIKELLTDYTKTNEAPVFA